MLSWLAAQMQKVQKAALLSDATGRPFAAVFRQGPNHFLTLAISKKPRLRIEGRTNETKNRR